jgi:hypothetical protein
MTLEAMPREAIESVVASEERPNVLVLTTGDVLYVAELRRFEDVDDRLGDDRSLSEEFDRPQEAFEDEDHLVSRYYAPGYESETVVPYSDVADVVFLPFEQQTRASDTTQSTRLPPSEVAMYERSLAVAKRAGYPVRDLHIAHDLGTQSGFSWGPVTFTRDTPLYCDWDDLQRRSGGLTSLGGGALGISLSAGWEASLWSEFRDVVNTTRVEISDLEDHSAAATTGYVEFVTHEGEYVDREMDGNEWIAGVVSEDPVEDPSDLARTSWAIGFFERDSLMFPLETWEYVENAVTLYGDVVDSPIQTGFGDVECFLKVRAAAYVGDA